VRATSERPGARLLTIHQAANEYGITPGSLRALIASRKLPSVELPGVRRVLIPRAVLEELIEASTRPVA
jgi:excisionase family DNA binding protein